MDIFICKPTVLYRNAFQNLPPLKFYHLELKPPAPLNTSLPIRTTLLFSSFTKLKPYLVYTVRLEFGNRVDGKKCRCPHLTLLPGMVPMQH